MPAGRPKADRQMAHCREAGLSCRECVRAAAADLVQISAGLDASLVRQIFFLMYPEHACASMATEFVQAVHAHAEGRLVAAGPAPARLEPEPRWRAAVA
ncbi:MAG: hypothetical protein N2036_00910 [Bryobacteraceae bacterium]|nr:hypothetical protein [Bryobacteraceae bacterium]MCX7602613.1 hypothetical protein [Bryobacteraceae bacterium]